MSTVGPATYNTLSRTLEAATALQQQEAALQQQTTTGKVSQSYAGLATVSAQVLDLSAASGRLDAYATTIAAAQGKAAVTQDALTQIGALTSGLAAAALGLSGSPQPGAVDSVAQQARQALAQLGSLLNSSYAGDYVFAGADTAHPPVPGDIAASGLYAQVGAQLTALATVPTTPPLGTVIANTVAIAASAAAGTTVFSPYLGSGAAAAAQVTIGDREQVSVSALANSGAIGDIVRGLTVLANSHGALAANPDFAALAKDVAGTLTAAGGALARQSGQIGLAQNALTAASAAHGSLKTILAAQLSSLTDVNLAQAISQLQAVTSQLTASYKVIALTSGLNLASYISG